MTRRVPMDLAAEVRRVDLIMAKPNTVFVFGSNTQGKHGGGAARVAWARFHAHWGVGEGPTGQAYAIPTMRFGDDELLQLPIAEIAAAVDRLAAYARAHPELTFAVTRVGCGIAGFTDEAIAPLFADAPPNCLLPDGWRTLATSPDVSAAPAGPLSSSSPGTVP